jgi:hypothetical protein
MLTKMKKTFIRLFLLIILIVLSLITVAQPFKWNEVAPDVWK